MATLGQKSMQFGQGDQRGEFLFDQVARAGAGQGEVQTLVGEFVAITFRVMNLAGQRRIRGRWGVRRGGVARVRLITRSVMATLGALQPGGADEVGFDALDRGQFPRAVGPRARGGRVAGPEGDFGEEGVDVPFSLLIVSFLIEP